jgi:hypothetical protein
VKNPLIVALLSALCPGLGQFVAGRRERGLAILAGWLTLPALYGIIIVGTEQLARSQGIASAELRQFLAGRSLFLGQVDLYTLIYAFACLVVYWLLNIGDAAVCMGGE